ncbi:hypothetical protein [Cellulosimicrobium sp. Marseille-Q4280]|uniref:hypothetical protein n=1 Tax=Cellulosimicrobium sp. Marseille-Q4280 TaxID=2937992 RepID=UPI00203BEA36|nr:hypothetical protein [Cellulosimicrobium sp. Marseille-Q4280]
MTSTDDDYVAPEPITVHLTPDHVEIAESVAIDTLENDENDGMSTFDLGVKIARAVLSAAAQPVARARGYYQPDSLAGQVYELANRLRQDGQGDLADELDRYVAVHGRAPAPSMAVAAASARFDNDAVHAYRNVFGSITIWVRGPGTGDEPWTQMVPAQSDVDTAQATDADVAESMLGALAYAGVPVPGPEDTARALAAPWRKVDARPLGHEARPVEAAVAAELVRYGFVPKQLDGRVIASVLEVAGLLVEDLPAERSVPQGLCANKADHAPHRVEHAPVADGPMHCHGDQTRRMPWAAEQAQRAAGVTA